MPCFVTKFNLPSKVDYEAYCSLGYTGTYEQYLELKKDCYDPNAVIFITGEYDDGDGCRHTDCEDLGSFLCDYPVGELKTCDAKMCESHSNMVGEDMHYCETHYKLWLETPPKELHVESNPAGFLVDGVFYSIEKAWVARNKSAFLNQPMIRVFAELTENNIQDSD